ncbi:hypothetical protein LTR17_000029 [Elasticomyces elasticus]|nr:hypothetical protein LTR17_000029 [Elasticomyces elasticus]
MPTPHDPATGIRNLIYELAFQHPPGRTNITVRKRPVLECVPETEANFSLTYTGMSVLQYPVGFTALDLTKIRNLTFFAPLGPVVEMLGTDCGRFNEDDIMSYKRLADTRWACTSVYEEPPQHDNDVRLTGSSPGTLDIMMRYKRLSDTRWACTSVCDEPQAGGEESPGVCLAKAFCLYCYITEQC